MADPVAAPGRTTTPFPGGGPPAVRRLPALRLGLLLVLLCGCDRAGPLPAPSAESPILDPRTLEVGDTVLGLRVDAMDVRPDLVDSFGWTGSIRFQGRATLSGTYRPHPDLPEPSVICFFPDAISAARLPRFPNDGRVSWFCFPDDAGAMLPTPAGSATVTIEGFEYRYEHTDTYNTADLVEVVEAR